MVAVGRVDAEPLAVVDHVEDDLPELLELVDVVAPRLRQTLRVVRVLRLAHPHHLGLDAAEERVAELLLDLVRDPLEILARVGFEGLAGLGVVAVAEDSRDTLVPRELRKRVEVGDRRELGFLGAEADVAVLPVDEQVGGRAVDELVALLGDLLPLRRDDALAVDVTRDRDLLEEDVLDAALVDQLADLPDLLQPIRIVPGLVERREGIGDRPLARGRAAPRYGPDSTTAIANSFFARGLARDTDSATETGAGAEDGGLRTSFVWRAFSVCLECRVGDVKPISPDRQ